MEEDIKELQTKDGTFIEDIHSSLEIPVFSEIEADQKEQEKIPEKVEGGI